MADIGTTKARALAASERSRWRASMARSLPVWGVVVALAVARPGALEIAGALAGLCLVGVVLGVWRRDSGRAAMYGIGTGAPVVLGAAFASACAPSLAGWECGVPCLLLGAVSAFAFELLAARAGPQRTTVAAFAALTSFVGCAPMGIGIAVAAAAVTATSCVGASVLRPRLVRGP